MPELTPSSSSSSHIPLSPGLWVSLRLLATHQHIKTAPPPLKAASKTLLTDLTLKHLLARILSVLLLEGHWHVPDYRLSLQH